MYSVDTRQCMGYSYAENAEMKPKYLNLRYTNVIHLLSSSLYSHSLTLFSHEPF